MSWTSWAAGVLQGIGAPTTPTNLDTLWAWSNAESGADVMRWNNPLNTTQPEGPGNRDANDVGVKIYPTESQGVRATVITLLNGHYPVIVDHLRRSVQRSSWSDACPNLGVWGTGCAWIQRTYGPIAGNITPEEVMDQATFNALVAGSPLANIVGGITSTYQAVIASQKAILQAIGALTAGSGLSAGQAQELQEAHDAATKALADLESIFNLKAA